MPSFGEKIKIARKAKKYTQKQLAEKIGAAHNSISDWENDKNKPDPDTIELLCGVLEITPNYLMSSSSDELSPKDKSFIRKYHTLDLFGQQTVDMILNREYERVELIKKQLDRISYLESTPIIAGKETNTVVRLYTYMHKIASAGNGFYFDDIPTDTLEAPYLPGADFIIGVNGDSMEPTYSDGDLVYVEKKQIIEVGEIGVFILNNECFIKEVGEKGLVSHNEKYDMIPGSEKIQCIGKVLGKVEIN
ncbi:MAG: XRE family transcriptional regulator [Bacillota bacterium]|nr:XRE family transcriptional regulator [Bacillota bacterium]